MFRNPPALAGFAAGICGTLVLALLVSVLFTGAGLSDRGANTPSVVYQID